MRNYYLPAFLIFMVACNSSGKLNKNNTTIRIDSLIDNLYKTVGSEDVDSLGKIYDTITYEISSLKDTVLSAPDNYSLDSLVTISGELRNYLEACNSYESEIYLEEQNIRSIEKKFQSKAISEGLYIEKLNTELSNLLEIRKNIDERKQEINQIVQRYKPLMDNLKDKQPHD